MSTSLSSPRRLARAAVAIAILVIAGGCSSLRPNSYNLLKASRPSSDTVAGKWMVEKSMLQSEVSDYARIGMPVVPHGDYRLQMKFARAIGEDAVIVLLPVADRQVALVVDGRRGDAHFSGLGLIDGNRSYENITTDRNFQIINHQIYRLDVTARTKDDQATIHVDLDKKPFVRWSGPINTLSLPDEWALTGDARIGIGSNNGVVQVRSAWLHMIPGQVTRVPR